MTLLNVNAVTPYDSENFLSMKSLAGLENAGIKIVTSLENRLTELQSVTGIVLDHEDKIVHWDGKERSKAECLIIFIRRWLRENGHHSPTWRSLLNEILPLMDLRELSQQIEAFLLGKMNIPLK